MTAAAQALVEVARHAKQAQTRSDATWAFKNLAKDQWNSLLDAVKSSPTETQSRLIQSLLDASSDPATRNNPSLGLFADKLLRSVFPHIKNPVLQDRLARHLVSNGAGLASQATTDALLKKAIDSKDPDLKDKLASNLAQSGLAASKKFALLERLAGAGSAEAKRQLPELHREALEQRIGKIRKYLGVAKADIAKTTQRLHELRQLKAAAESDPALYKRLSQANFDSSRPPQVKIDAEIQQLQAKLGRYKSSHEKQAAELGRALADPKGQALLAQLPREALALLMAGAAKVMAGTKAGSEFIQRHLAPALMKPGSDPVFEKLFKVGKKGHDAALKFMETVTPELLLKSEKALQAGWARLFGGSKGLEQVQQGLGDLRTSLAQGTPLNDRAKAAQAVLKKMGLDGHLNKVSAALGVFNLVPSLMKVFKDPSLRNTLASSKDAADAAEKLMKLMPGFCQKYPKLGLAAKLLGSNFAKLVKGGVDAVVGYIDLQKGVENRDRGAAIGSYLSFAGGVLSAAGIVFPPAFVAGAAAGLAGELIKWTLGDSAAETLAKKLGYL